MSRPREIRRSLADVSRASRAERAFAYTPGVGPVEGLRGHRQPTPYLGGATVVLAVVLATGALAISSGQRDGAAVLVGLEAAGSSSP